jgi:hypothetical protein
MGVFLSPFRLKAFDNLNGSFERAARDFVRVDLKPVGILDKKLCAVGGVENRYFVTVYC